MKAFVRILALALVMDSATISAQVYNMLHQFGGPGSDGTLPIVGMVLSGGQLYGTTASGGGSGFGTIFKMNTDGTAYLVLRSLTGGTPEGTFVLIDSTLYGTTYSGGTNGYGSIFKINTGGDGYSVLHNFSSASGSIQSTNVDGSGPIGDLATDGTMLYGTTQKGGPNGNGTIFKINKDGSGFAVLKSFSTCYIATNVVSNDSFEGYGTNVDGANPRGGLAISANVLYGVTQFGGLSNGVVFAVQTDGSGYRVLKYFSGLSDRAGTGTNQDGAVPTGGLVVSGDTIYGTTDVGGSGAGGNVFRLKTDGSEFSSLHDFSFTNDGGLLFNTLLLDGATLYGSTEYGGLSNRGTIFMVMTNGSGFEVLRNLDNVTGSQCKSKFVLSRNILYGTAQAGGTNGDGVIFSLAVLPQIVNDAQFGIQSNRFGFNLTGISNQTAVVQSCTNIFQHVWIPLQTNILTGAPIYFSDINSVSNGSAFYRVLSP